MSLDLADVPLIDCHESEINQALLNIVVNAAQAFTMSSSSAIGRISVTLRSEKQFVLIQIADNAGGIPAEIQSRIFETFFTTKQVGEGTGQGLAIAHSIVVERHRGEIDLESNDLGTTFTIRLPVVALPTAAS